MQTKTEFILVTGDTLVKALQQLPGAVQEVTAGKPFEVTAMTTMQEVFAPGIGSVKPKLQVSLVVCVAYQVETELMPGLSDYMKENKKHGLVDPGKE